MASRVSLRQATMNISLTAELEKYVRGKVASGYYNNASEVIREALRVLVERERASAKRADRESPRKDSILNSLAALERPLRERGLTSLALFGSIVRGSAGPNSDIDVLIDIDSTTRFSLIDLVSVKDYLEDRLGRSVDVVTRGGLEPAIKDRVLREAEKVF